jgi:zinc protease
MKATLALVLTLALGSILPAAASGPAATPRHPHDLTLGPLEFTPLKVERDTLDCGIPVLLNVDHDLPLLDLTMQFRMGRRYLPVESHVVSDIMSPLWRDGGTTTIRPDSLDDLLTALDATISTWVGEMTGGVSVSLSSEDLTQALPLWRDVILRPGFDTDRLQRARANRLKSLQEINNDPQAIAFRRIRWLLLGEKHPGAHLQTRGEIDQVDPSALRDLHSRFVRPSNAFLGVSGDFDRRKMLTLLNDLFRDWPRSGSTAAPVLQDWTPHPEPGVYLLRGDYEQSQVCFGRIIRELNDDSPDYAAVQILSYALGNSRVFYRVREEGLSYGAQVWTDVGRDFTTLQGFGSGRGAATVALARALLEETRGLKTKPIVSREMESARIFRIGGHLAASETPAALVSRRIDALVMGKPEDYQDQLLRRLRTVTAADLERVADRYVTRSDSLVVLILGKPEEFDAPLDSLGLGPARELKPVVFGE